MTLTGVFVWDWQWATSDNNSCIREFGLSLCIGVMEINNECSNDQKRKCNHIVNYK